MLSIFSFKFKVMGLASLTIISLSNPALYDMIAHLTYNLAKPIITMRSITSFITCPNGQS